jgi:hypothetical protein
VNIQNIVKHLSSNSRPIGKALMLGINEEIEKYNVNLIDIKTEVSDAQTVIGINKDNRHVNSIARIILFGDPTSTPVLINSIDIAETQPFL